MQSIKKLKDRKTIPLEKAAEIVGRFEYVVMDDWLVCTPAVETVEGVPMSIFMVLTGRHPEGGDVRYKFFESENCNVPVEKDALIFYGVDESEDPDEIVPMEIRLLKQITEKELNVLIEEK